MGRELVNDVQVARELGLHPQTLRNWRTRKTGPPFLKLGFAIRYDPQDVQAWLAQHRRPGEEVGEVCGDK